MAATTEELRTIFTGDTTDLEAKAEQSSRVINRFSKTTEDAGGKISNVGQKISSASAHGFGRMAGDLINLATNSSGAVREISALTPVLGAVGAIGALAIYEVVSKLVEAADAAQTANVAIDKLAAPRGGGAFREIGEVSSHLAEVSAKLQEVKGQATFFGATGVGDFVNQKLFGGATHATEQKKLEDSQNSEANALAQQYQIAAGIQAELLTGNERSGDLDKAHLETLLHQSEIYDRLIGQQPQLNAALDAEAKAYTAVNASLERKHYLIQSEVGLENDLQDIRAQGLTKDKESLAILQRRKDEADTRAYNTSDQQPEAKKKAQAESKAAGNALDDEEFRQYAARKANPTEYRRKQQAEARLRDQFERSKAPSAPNAYLRSPDAYGGPDDGPSNPNGRPYKSQLDSARVSSIQSGAPVISEKGKRPQPQTVGNFNPSEMFKRLNQGGARSRAARSALSFAARPRHATRPQGIGAEERRATPTIDRQLGRTTAVASDDVPVTEPEHHDVAPVPALRDAVSRQKREQTLRHAAERVTPTIDKQLHGKVSQAHGAAKLSASKTTANDTLGLHDIHRGLGGNVLSGLDGSGKRVSGAHALQQMHDKQLADKKAGQEKGGDKKEGGGDVGAKIDKLIEKFDKYWGEGGS